MSIDLERFCCILNIIMPSLFESTCIGVAGCVCTISSNVVLTTMDFMELINRAAHSTSEADAITF